MHAYRGILIIYILEEKRSIKDDAQVMHMTIWYLTGFFAKHSLCVAALVMLLLPGLLESYFTRPFSLLMAVGG